MGKHVRRIETLRTGNAEATRILSALIGGFHLNRLSLQRCKIDANLDVCLQCSPHVRIADSHSSCSGINPSAAIAAVNTPIVFRIVAFLGREAAADRHAEPGELHEAA